MCFIEQVVEYCFEECTLLDICRQFFFTVCLTGLASIYSVNTPPQASIFGWDFSSVQM